MEQQDEGRGLVAKAKRKKTPNEQYFANANTQLENLNEREGVFF